MKQSTLIKVGEFEEGRVAGKATIREEGEKRRSLISLIIPANDVTRNNAVC